MPEPVKEEIAAAHKKEVNQAYMALYIPLVLFLATVIFAAGAFLIYNQEPIGWAFIAVTVVGAMTSFVALIRFHNKYREKGILPDD